MDSRIVLPFDNSYTRLPARFYSRHLPEPVSDPGLIRVNRELATYLGIDPNWLESEAGIAFVAGNQLPPGADPIATVYAGHQFGGWNPRLGDGRALLVGELVADDGVRHDIQLKGSGRTTYSRGGDGRAPVGPVLREYVVSEAMAVLGVPTTRALAAVTTGDPVYREGALPGAVLARVAGSHVRIGTLQYFASQQDHLALQIIVDYVAARHYPQAMNAGNRALALLDNVIERQARLIAQWQLLGFIHGVMNTDNMLLSGETIDYGPCAYMDEYDPDKVFSSIDHAGRYRYKNQPQIAHWNLVQLAQTLLPLIDADTDRAVAQAQESINRYPQRYLTAFKRLMRDKLGLSTEAPGDDQLIDDLLALMEEHSPDFTLTFRRLSEMVDPASGEHRHSVGDIFVMPEAFSQWIGRWQNRVAKGPRGAREIQAAMYRANPAYIPRNHLVEEVIDAATRERDFAPFHALVEVLARPFEYDSKLVRYATPPRPEQVVRQTFCGT